MTGPKQIIEKLNKLPFSQIICLHQGDAFPKADFRLAKKSKFISSALNPSSIWRMKTNFEFHLVCRRPLYSDPVHGHRNYLHRKTKLALSSTLLLSTIQNLKATNEPLGLFLSTKYSITNPSWHH